MARRTIDRAFASEGIELRPDVPMILKSGQFLASGYDATRRVGYIFGSRATLEADTFIDWQNVELDDAVSQVVERELNQLKSFQFRARRLPTDLESARYECHVLVTHYLPWLLSAEHEEEARIAEQISDPWQRLATLQVVAVKSAESLLEKYETEDDELLRQQLLSKSVHPGLRSEQRKAMALADPESRKQALGLLLTHDANVKLSLREVRELQTDSPVGDIAVITPFDQRFEYQSRYFRVAGLPDRLKSRIAVQGLRQRDQTATDKIQAIVNPLERFQAELDWEAENASGTIERLESEVRAFVKWTRRKESR